MLGWKWIEVKITFKSLSELKYSILNCNGKAFEKKYIKEVVEIRGFALHLFSIDLIIESFQTECFKQMKKTQGEGKLLLDYPFLCK